METIKKDLGYQFIPIPMNLYLTMDINCRSMFTTMVQLSSYYADDNGWFFRTNSDLQAETKLSENLVRATISSLYSQGLIEVKSVGKSKGTIPNYFKLNIGRFPDWDKYSIEDCCKNPLYDIETDDYKAKGWKASYLLKSVEENKNEDKEMEVRDIYKTDVSTDSLPHPSKSDYNINNIENQNNNSKNENVNFSNDKITLEEYKK